MMDDIVEFYSKFQFTPGKPSEPLEKAIHEYRAKLGKEEADEYADAYREGDIAAQLDALVDQVYVALGTAYLHGFFKETAEGLIIFEEAWRRVHAANMKKIRAEHSEHNPSGRDWRFDVVKPPDWQAPSHEDLLR
jgi:predicted HAD superfamily Cof-like phosphohydrolase